LRLQQGLADLEITDPDRAARIRTRAHTSIAKLRDNFPGDPATGILDESEEAAERFEAFGNDEPCPVLDPATGACDLYSARPMTCRVFGPPIRMDAGDSGDDNAEALGHCELCFIGATPEEVAACEMLVPHDLEAKLLDEIPDKSETVVAFALLS
jgi:Fe-S-cluster containining protein